MSMNVVAPPVGVSPWYAGLTARHWRILWGGSYLGCVFDRYESLALIYALRPALASLLTPQQALKKHNLTAPGTVYVIGLVAPWFMPETVGQPLPE